MSLSLHLCGPIFFGLFLWPFIHSPTYSLALSVSLSLSLSTISRQLGFRLTHNVTHYFPINTTNSGTSGGWHNGGSRQSVVDGSLGHDGELDRPVAPENRVGGIPFC